jgi:RNA polymerase sigma-70 factor (ECF subfamily)
MSMDDQRSPFDAAFLDRLRNRRADAFDRLVREFQTPLYRFHFCQHGDHHSAQDQTAETFVQLVRSLPSMRGGVNQLRAFVFAVARRVQQRRWRANRSTARLEFAMEVADPHPQPDAELAEREQVHLVLDAIRGLDETVRNVLLLRFVEECSLDEVAAALDMPLGTVKSHLHRGRAQLARKLAEKGCQT